MNTHKVRITLVDNDSDSLTQLRQTLSQIGDLTLTHHTAAARIDLDRVDLLTLSGGVWRSSGGNESRYAAEIKLISDAVRAAVPTLGVCLGMHLVVIACGGGAEEMGLRREGWVELEDGSLVWENHSRAVTALPPDLLSHQRSRDGEEWVRHRHAPLSGFQFHPEMGGAGTEILRAEINWLLSHPSHAQRRSGSGSRAPRIPQLQASHARSEASV